ncbi:ABC transporter permease [Microbacterium sp.]|uniref:ABC transporter permease n=1 Tax=Microbacterium sp. TaxID=51671 RepID=UPI00262A4771|nr:ABC transporter permease [Microbacterium sp.]
MQSAPVRVAVFALRKIAGAFVTLFVLVSVVFLLIQLTPGDEAVAAAGPGASPEKIEQLREQLGLAGPLIERYAGFLGRIAQGDLGVSSVSRGSVADAIASALPTTAELVVVSVVLSMLIAFPLAGLSAIRATGRGESWRRFLIILVCGLPTFWLALMFQRLFGSILGWFPISGRYTIGVVSVPDVTGSALLDGMLAGDVVAVSDALAHIALPAIILSLAFVGPAYRVIRAEFISASGQDFVMVARATGQSRLQVLRRNIVPHVLTPTLILIGIEFGSLFGGAVLVESVFGRDGLGSMLTNAVAQKDSSVVVGGVLAIGVIVIVVNSLVDVAHSVRDPRVRRAEMGI